MFEIDPGVLVSPEEDVDAGEDRWVKQEKLDTLRKKFRKEQMPAPFRDTTLGAKVLHALMEWRRDQEGQDTSGQPHKRWRKPFLCRIWVEGRSFRSPDEGSFPYHAITFACVHLHGKDRKQRAIPYWRSTAREARAWLQRNQALKADAPLLPNREGHAMTRYNVNQRLKLAVTRAAETHPSLAKRQVSPHCRHSTAMHMLQAGVPFNVIALYLGHQTPAKTHRYAEANLAMKEQALARLDEHDAVVPRYRPPDDLRQFLQDL